MNHHHRETLAQIMRHPVSHNIEWHDVLSLLETVGTVEERHHNKVAVTVGDETQVFELPRHKDIDEQLVMDLRRMLTNAGYGPEA
ncbi:MAG TPA: hypothetical protein VHW47_06645 [Acidimicrobiales bacterium]|jgi:hypothetical protein|nr:hypothetical protein [Acidimicrobiales bacterium]